MAPDGGGAQPQPVQPGPFNCGGYSNWGEFPWVGQNVCFEIVEWRPLVRVRAAGWRVGDPVVVEVPIEFEASKYRSEPTAHVNDQHLQLRMAIEHAGGHHPGAVDGRVEGAANRLVEAVLHKRLVPNRLHRWMDVHHDVTRFRKLPQPFRLG